MDSTRSPLTTHTPGGQFCGRTRRELLWEAGGGFASVALTALLGGDGFLSRQAVAADGVSRFVNPMAPRKPAPLLCTALAYPPPADFSRFFLSASSTLWTEV